MDNLLPQLRIVVENQPPILLISQLVHLLLVPLPLLYLVAQLNRVVRLEDVIYTVQLLVPQVNVEELFQEDFLVAGLFELLSKAVLDEIEELVVAGRFLYSHFKAVLHFFVFMLAEFGQSVLTKDGVVYYLLVGPA